MDKYELIDSLISFRIKQTPGLKFHQIDCGDIRKEAEFLVANTGRDAFRVTDARLQALKKRGVIRYQNGWFVCTD